MRWLNQIVEITLMNLRNIPQRLGSSLVIVIGIAGVVGVLVSVLAMSAGFRSTLASTGRTDRVMMLRAGSDAELSSAIDREQAALMKALPQIARNADGQALATAELVTIVDLPRKGETTPNNVPIRGVEPAAFDVRSEVKIVEGRRFEPGVREIIVGRKAAQQFAGLDVGSRIGFRDSDWEVVGHFESGGDVHESELWTDAEVAMSAFRRGGFQSMTALLADGSDAGFEAFKQAVEDDPRLRTEVYREPEYYAKQAGILSVLINILGYFVAAFMAVGAIFGALNCMYSAIADRAREIATLRALGFGGLPVMASVMVEALVLALAGGILGAALAWLYSNGAQVSTLNFSTFSQVAFDFRVTPSLIVQGLIWALLIGLIGGFFPAIKAARQPVTTALREL